MDNTGNTSHENTTELQENLVKNLENNEKVMENSESNVATTYNNENKDNEQTDNNENKENTTETDSFDGKLSNNIENDNKTESDVGFKREIDESNEDKEKHNEFSNETQHGKLETITVETDDINHTGNHTGKEDTDDTMRAGELDLADEIDDLLNDNKKKDGVSLEDELFQLTKDLQRNSSLSSLSEDEFTKDKKETPELNKEALAFESGNLKFYSPENFQFIFMFPPWLLQNKLAQFLFEKVR